MNELYPVENQIQNLMGSLTISRKIEGLDVVIYDLKTNHSGIVSQTKLE